MLLVYCWNWKGSCLFSAIPFIKNPEQNDAFEMYFQRAWQDTFFLSLYNFLITLFHHMHILYQLLGICNQAVVWCILKHSSISTCVTSTRNDWFSIQATLYEVTWPYTDTAYWQNYLHTVVIMNYKITKIVCTLWFSERCVCMRVCKCVLLFAH